MRLSLKGPFEERDDGRVFYSALGHPDAAWDDPRVLTMYLEAIKWAAGKTNYPIRPHPIPE